MLRPQKRADSFACTVGDRAGDRMLGCVLE